MVKPAGSRFLRLLLVAPRVFRAALAEHADAYHLHDPELLPIAVALKLFGKRVVYDAHEHLPQQLRQRSWCPAPIQRCLAAVAGAVEWAMASVLDGIVCATPVIARRFPPGKTLVVRNLPRIGSGEQPHDDYYSRGNVAVYIGLITDLRGFTSMCDAIQAVRPSVEAQLLLAGRCEGRDVDSRLQAANPPHHIKYLGALSHDGAQALLRQARVGLFTPHDVPNIRDSYPTKIFEYLAAGIPVIASDFLLRDFPELNDCILRVNPLETDDLVEKLEWVFSNPREAHALGQKGQSLVRTRLNWEREGHVLADFYGRMLCPATR